MKKKNVQRALALALAATMLAGTVAGCGKSSDSDSTQEIGRASCRERV